jgi:hypothetical protein
VGGGKLESRRDGRTYTHPVEVGANVEDAAVVEVLECKAVEDVVERRV